MKMSQTTREEEEWQQQPTLTRTQLEAQLAVVEF
jgi:hypothetical protein